MRVILDTNVGYAGLRSHRGASAAVLAMVATGRFELVMSVALALEYEEVLKRDPARLAVTEGEVDELVAFLCANAERRELPGRSWPLSAERDDDFLAHLAMAGACDVLVTHNVRHLRGLGEQGVRVVTPGEFLRIIGVEP